MALSSRGKLLVVLAAPVVVFGGLEVGLRVCGFEHQLQAIPVVVWNRDRDEAMRGADALHRYDPATLWAPRPGAALPDGDDEVVNADGYRGPRLAREKPAGVRRVALLGESAIFGLGLPWEDTAAAQLVELAADRGVALEVLDAGVIGYTAWQGVARHDVLVRHYDADVVFAAFGTVNEHFPCKGLPDERKLREARRTWSLPGRAAMWLRTHLRVALLASWLSVRLAGRSLEEEARRSRARVLANARAVGYGAEDWGGERRVSLASFERAMGALRDAVHAEGARFVMVAMPRGPEVLGQSPVVRRYTEALRALQGTLDVPLLDLAAAHAAHVAAGGDGAWFHDDALHLSRAGNRRLAEAMLAFVVE